MTTEQFFRCTLQSDVILNASLATEGNMNSLDYIPGSNFLGIVAGRLYWEGFSRRAAYRLFHSGEVSFGDAQIAMGNALSYAMPFAVLKDKKEKRKIGKGAHLYLQHGLPDGSLPEGLQLKQEREGYFDKDGLFYSEVEKDFVLKSAHDRALRRSKEGAMYGFQTLRKNQSFLFSVRWTKPDAQLYQWVMGALMGPHRIGKSRSSYGRVQIEPIARPALYESAEAFSGQRLLVYAQSNLCLLNAQGQASFQLSPKTLGITGNFRAELSSIRTYTYSPWNGHRKTHDRHRNVILKGSVLVFDLDQPVTLTQLPTQIGVYQAEGLGRVLYNPVFLEADHEGKWTTSLKRYEPKKEEFAKRDHLQTPLAKFLQVQHQSRQKALEIGQAVVDVKNKYQTVFHKLKITPSQWGMIRQVAVMATSVDDLHDKLWGPKEQDANKPEGLLMTGVAATRYWGKQNGKARNLLHKIYQTHKQYGTTFLAKFATEMAKSKPETSHSPSTSTNLPTTTNA
ncbi:MAG: hypothetical protein AAFV25_19850 [Bacteroidota bacterium]